ncbi:uncharacterized protein G2W53_044694 [Senna tora]|uniref:Uncharacterized protein n=1 Tax=Senna tora TaxID=362788 RepID=A0A834W020_9FABA|nr:uncharacterized protein G2W53_044694 [Senna tora]
MNTHSPTPDVLRKLCCCLPNSTHPSRHVPHPPHQHLRGTTRLWTEFPCHTVVLTTEPFTKLALCAANSKAPATIEELLPKLKLPENITVITQPGLGQ